MFWYTVRHQFWMAMADGCHTAANFYIRVATYCIGRAKKTTEEMMRSYIQP